MSNHTSQTLHIVYATDDAYLFAVEASLASAEAMTSDPQRTYFHILNCGISDKAWQAFHLRHPEVLSHPINMETFSGFHLWHGSLGTYARLNIPELLQSVSWCLYVDGDTLFTDDPLKLIEEIEHLRHHPEGPIALAGHTTSMTTQPAWYKAHHLPLHRERYVCAGVILMNLDYFRQHHISQQCMAFIQAHPDAPFPDQDALNLSCQGHIALLPDTWGDYSGAAFGKAKRPGCVHYVGELPWKLTWKWHLGYSDAVKVWSACVEGLLGYSRQQSMHIGLLRWFVGRCYNRLIRLGVFGFQVIPAFRKRFPNFQNRFIASHWRPMTTITYWKSLNQQQHVTEN